MDRKSTSALTGIVFVSFLLSHGLKSTPGPERASRGSASQQQTAGGTATNRNSSRSDQRSSTISLSRKEDVAKIASKDYADRFYDLIQASCPNKGDCQPKPSEFLIALVPDPVHTHLALQFDRAIEVIEEAMQDEGFVYDRAIMPWDPKAHPESEDYENRIESKWYEESKQQSPGLMLFRGGNKRPGQWMFVLVVAETPTHGIKNEQFLKALSLIQQTTKMTDPSGKKQTTNKGEPGLRILGPTFSGSLSSLVSLLKCSKPNEPTYTCSSTRPPISIYSGTVSSRTDILDFVKHESELNMRFVTFQESDDVMIERFVEYLTGDGYGAGSRDLRHYFTKHVAALSEDETAYGASLNASGAPSSTQQAAAARDCESNQGEKDANCILKLVFPREISQLRAAYQDNLKESATSDSHAVPRDTLPSNFSVPGSDDDTVASYSSKLMPLSQESIMLSIVSELRKHRIEYVILRATDPMDSLFLSEYLRTVFPQGRIVTIGADMLFRREADDPRLHGLLALSTYPLEPAGNHYFASYEAQHFERIFPSADAAGTYNAICSLLLAPASNDVKILDGAACTEVQDNPYAKCRHLLVKSSQPPAVPLFLYGYGWLKEQCPAWDRLDKEPRAQVDRNCTYCAPPVHLLALGRDQYWPVANLGPLESGQHATYLPRIGGQIVGPVLPIEIPYSWQAVQLVAAALGLSFSVSLWRSSVFSKTQSLTSLAPASADFRGTLILFAGMSLFIITLILLWPYLHGAQSDLPIVKYSLYVAGISVFISTVVEWLTRRVLLDGEDEKSHNWWKRWLPLFVFLLLSLVFVQRVFFTPYSENPAFVLRFSTIRAVQLASGLSFIMPWFFFLTVWLWWAYHLTAGCAVLDERRPRLPKGMGHQRVAGLNEDNFEGLRPEYHLGGVTNPLFWATPVGFIGSFLLLGDVRHPIMSLERPSVERYLDIFFSLAVAGVVVALLQLWSIWLGMRRLLLALDSTPLRRGFRSIKGFSWRPIWRVGVTSLDEFQRMYTRKKEALDCAINTVRVPFWSSRVDQEMTFTRECYRRVKEIPHRLIRNWWMRRKAERELIRQFGRVQTAVAEAAGAALDYLAQSWCMQIEEANSLAEDGREKDPKIRACERVVCLSYIDFLLAALIRIRTLIIAIGGMYVLTILGVTQYPFEPKGTIQVMLFVVLAFIVGVVGTVFAQIHRDTTLSNITDTTPGELGRDFWFRMASFVALPLFSLLATQFPSVNRFFYSWLQPAIQALNR